MNVSPSKENILKKIRKALTHSTPLPFPKSEGNESVYHAPAQELAIEFAEAISTKLQGRFIFCINQQELAFQLNSLVKKMDWQKVYCLEDALVKATGPQLEERLVQTGLAHCDVSITGCECLVISQNRYHSNELGTNKRKNHQCICSCTYLYRPFQSISL